MDNNDNIEYDLSYLILKNNKILGIYDNSEITFVKYINLISNELDILLKLKKKNVKITEDVLSDLKSYIVQPLIKNSDILLSTIKLSFNDFILIDSSNIIIDIMNSKLKYYLIKKIMDIKKEYQIINTH